MFAHKTLIKLKTRNNWFINISIESFLWVAISIVLSSMLSLHLAMNQYDTDSAFAIIIVGLLPSIKLLFEIYLKTYDPLLPIYYNDSPYALPID